MSPRRGGAASGSRRGVSVRQVAHEVSHEVAGIVLRAVNERRFATPQHRQSNGIHAGGVGDEATVVAQLALAVVDRNVEPAIVGAEAGGPDDRTDLAAAQVE